MGNIVGKRLRNGEEVVAVATTATNTDNAAFLTRFPGVGKPFWYFDTIPSGRVVGADFSDAPIVSEDVSENRAAIAAITVKPEDVLFFEE